VLLVALIVVHTVVNVVWLATDLDPPMNHHSSEQTALLHYLVLKGYPPVTTHGHKVAYEVVWPDEPGRTRGSLEPLVQPLRKGTDPSWLPLSMFHLASVLLASLFGPSYASLTLAGTVFFAITVISVFLLVQWVRGSWAGLLAALIVSSYPFVFGCPRQYFIYQSAASMCALAVALLVRSDRFRRPWIAALAALAVSLGMRAGESGTDGTLLLMNLAGPLAVALWLGTPRRLDPRGGRIDRRLRGLILFAVVLLSTAGWRWFLGEYVVNTLWWNIQAGGSSTTGVDISPPSGTWEFYSLHVLELGLQQIRSIPLVAAATGGLVCLAVRWKRPLSWTLMLWIAVPVVLLSGMTQKNVWYLNSILPALAVASALAIASLRGHLRTAVVIVVVVACVHQVVSMTAAPNAESPMWRSQHRRSMNMAHYRYVPPRYDEPTTRPAVATRTIGRWFDELDPERTGLLTVGLMVPGDTIGGCRVEQMLKSDRPSMLTYTLLDPGAFAHNLGKTDVVLSVAEQGVVPRTDD